MTLDLHFIYNDKTLHVHVYCIVMCTIDIMYVMFQVLHYIPIRDHLKSLLLEMVDKERKGELVDR